MNTTPPPTREERLERALDILQFNSDPKTGLAEKCDLYLAGMSHFAIETMDATNATEFETSKTFTMKDNSKKYKCRFVIEEERQPAADGKETK